MTNPSAQVFPIVSHPDPLRPIAVQHLSCRYQQPSLLAHPRVHVHGSPFVPFRELHLNLD